MKRVDESEYLALHLPPVRLYRGDVENLIDILTNSGLNVVISDSEFTYDDLDELRAHRGTEIKELKIDGADPESNGTRRVSVKLSNHKDAYLSLYGRRPPLESCWHRLRDFLTARRRWHQKILNPWFAWVLVIFAGLAGELLEQAFPSRADSAHALAYGIAIAFWASCLYFARAYPVVLLDRQHEHESFWRRNRDKITLTFIGAVIGSIVTLAVRAIWGG